MAGEIFMYHVTNINGEEPRPDWDEIKLCVPNDNYFDGPLEGLPVACFTTTRYRNGMPSFSPYPRDARPGTKHWRFRTPFDPSKYRIFKVHEIGCQVHLLCLKRPDANGSDIENRLANLLSSTWELTNDDYRRYFPQGQANDYASSKFFVNVHFIHPVPVTYPKDPKTVLGEWDTIKRGDQADCTGDNYAWREIWELFVMWVKNHTGQYFAIDNEDKALFRGVPQLRVQPDGEEEAVIQEPLPAGEEEAVIQEPLPAGEEEAVIQEPLPAGEEEAVIQEPLPAGEEEAVIQEPLPAGEEEAVIQEPQPADVIETLEKLSLSEPQQRQDDPAHTKEEHKEEQ